jgi:hypothetical protein
MLRDSEEKIESIGIFFAHQARLAMIALHF